jgi:hypothetical protein
VVLAAIGVPWADRRKQACTSRGGTMRCGTQRPSSRCGGMDEKRRSPRQRVLKSGKIIYGGGSIVIDCTIRNLSGTGARLQVPTSVAIPDRFEFVEASSGKRWAASVAWRKGDLMGIRFET